MTLSIRENLSSSLSRIFTDTPDLGPIRFFSAPGRVNIIGEHVDYAGGLVFPAAIDFRTHFAIRTNQLGLFRLYSLDFQSEFVTKDVTYSEERPWANYILGVVSEARKLGLNVEGFDLTFTGNIPQGAGLSSSAALEVGVAFALSKIFHWDITLEKIALLSQAAENHFVGVNCGIMDQFVIAVAKPSSCISLNTESLEYSYHSLDLPGYEFYLIDSQVPHSLKESAYNDRRKEVESATSKCNKLSPDVRTLSQADFSLIEKAGLTPNEYKRATHILGERSRAQNVIRSLKDKDAEKVGKELFSCHESLSKNFQVSCEETDFIVEWFRSENVLGARMIGGGFGGCVLVLDKEGRSSSLFSKFEKEYFQKFGLNAKLYKFSISEGVREDTYVPLQ
ncbi:MULTISPECIES: galactokinase [unclassified Leptospira]|uniref:galactokinase n=1 Tax=unclassified Leptospira TaxID=2633828 RepID=UPI0002BF9161|nr:MULTISPECIES: galactokinase [unclassified Leptospira]EMJ98865.1 galactokinase [Leptospira sp. B5-022]MCR1794085.1 galactokinase [Leptospira sp. id769339]